jgi:uncharacterized protein
MRTLIVAYKRWRGGAVATKAAKLQNDTVLNVAQLLKDNVGSKRLVEVALDSLPLDDSTAARDVAAELKLTRISSGILVTGSLAGTARLECVRCLEEFETEYHGEVEAEFRPTLDIGTGVAVEVDEDDDSFLIDDNHQLDLAEMLRQLSILTLPIRPVCGDDCPGFTSEFRGDDAPAPESTGDERLAVLEQLLEGPRDDR